MMLRKKKPIQVTIVKYDNNEVTIYYDPNYGKHDHFAVVAGDEFRRKDIAAVEEWAIDKMKHANGLDWFPIILVHVDSKGFDFNANRYWLAEFPGSDLYRRVDFSVTESERVNHAARQHHLPIGALLPFKWEQPHVKGTFEYFLPYSEPLWHALLDTAERVDEIRDEFHAVLSNPDDQDVNVQSFCRWIGG